MTLRIIVAGATGWTGSAVAKGVLDADDMTLVGAVARASAGQDIGTVLGRDAIGLAVCETLEEALREPCDIVIDYTKPHVVKGHTITALNKGVHVVIGTSGLTADDFTEIEKLALQTIVATEKSCRLLERSTPISRKSEGPLVASGPLLLRYPSI